MFTRANFLLFLFVGFGNFVAVPGIVFADPGMLGDTITACRKYPDSCTVFTGGSSTGGEATATVVEGDGDNLSPQAAYYSINPEADTITIDFYAGGINSRFGSGASITFNGLVFSGFSREVFEVNVLEDTQNGAFVNLRIECNQILVDLEGYDYTPGVDKIVLGIVFGEDYTDTGCDPCGAPDPDSDGDGVPDSEDICPGFDDNIDADNDFVPDGCDPCPNDAENDADGDGVCGDVDACEGGDDNQNADGDTLPDFCDVCPFDVLNDADGDGVCEIDDNCEAVANSDQTDSDGDGFGDACDPDSDNDGVLNGDDNCPFDANADQADFDADGAGDVCDGDVDGDGVIDVDDQCLGTMLGDAVDASGCSIAELCPCEHPLQGNKWKNHGAYVRCVAHTSEDFVEAGLITEAEKDAIVSAAGQSDCGHKN